jgi:hypothetical protein
MGVASLSTWLRWAGKVITKIEYRLALLAHTALASLRLKADVTPASLSSITQARFRHLTSIQHTEVFFSDREAILYSTKALRSLLTLETRA